MSCDMLVSRFLSVAERIALLFYVRLNIVSPPVGW